MNVRGSVIDARVRYAREQGVAGYARFLTSLSDATRSEVEDGIAPERWYPLSTFVEVLEVLDSTFGNGDLELCYEMGRYSCDANMSTFHRFMLKLSSMDRLLDRASEAWAVHYDAGALTVVERADKRVTVRIDEHPAPHRAFCLSVKGWVVRAGEITGEKTVRSVGETCRCLGDAHCDLSFEW